MIEVLTARDCADWMGYSTEWIRRAIKTGVTAPDGRTTVRLEAQTVSLTGRRKMHRIYRDDFVEFLTAIGWTKIPRALPAFDAADCAKWTPQPKGA